MTTRLTDSSARRDAVPRLTRFVLVNERIPRANAFCAVCCTKIEHGYVRDPHTRLLYCDAGCFAEHEEISLPVGRQQARRMS
jgi:hypothetical protein